MRECEQNGFYPLTQRHIDDYIPASPGSFSLSVRLASGAHYTFHAGETDDLHSTLRLILEGDQSDLPYSIREYLDRFQCYLTYFVFPTSKHSAEIEKMLLQTSDPIARLRVISSN